MWRGIGAVLQSWREGDFWIVACFRWVAGELVVYSSKWTTGSALFLGFALFWAISWELVVHSSKWTTGSTLSLGFDLVSTIS